MRMSSSRQPRASISSRVVGRKAVRSRAGRPREEVRRETRDIRGPQVWPAMSPGSRSRLFRRDAKAGRRALGACAIARDPVLVAAELPVVAAGVLARAAIARGVGLEAARARATR